MSASFALDLLTDYGVWLLFGLGLHILMLCGQLSLGHGAIVGIGAYSAAIMTVKLGVPYYAVIPLCALVGAASGFIIAVVIASRLSGIYLALGTFALGEAIITFWLNVDYVGSAIGFHSIPMEARPLHVLLLVPVLLFLTHRLEISRFGMAFRAVRDDEVVAGSMGVNVQAMKTLAWMLGCSVTATGGALHAHRVSVISPPEFGFVMSVLLLLAPILGGTRNFWGAVVGMALVVYLPWILYFVQPELRLVFFGLLFIVMMVFRPQGLLGTTRA